MSVFLSHNSLDKSFVRRLGLRLQQRGVKVWIDEGEIKGGDSLVKKISDGLVSSNYVLAFISKNSINAPWVNFELETASTLEISKKKVKIIPIKLDDTEMPTFLLSKLYIDFTNESITQINFDQLLSAIDVDKHLVVSEKNLEELQFHDALVNEYGVVALASAPSAEDDYVFSNPDGTKYPTRDIYLLKILNGAFSVVRFSSIRIGHACLSENDKHYLIFANFKARPGTYEMTGCRYMIRKLNLGVQLVEPVFEDKNWGFFPTFNESGDIVHFSYNNYHKCINSEAHGRVDPLEMEKAHLSYLAGHSDQLIPNSSELIAKKLREFLS